MTDFLVKILYGSAEEASKAELNAKFFLVSALVVLILQFILFIIHFRYCKKTNTNKSDKKEYLKNLCIYSFINFLLAYSINSILLFFLHQTLSSVLICPAIAFVIAFFLSDKKFNLKVESLIKKKKEEKKDDDKKEDSNKSDGNHNDINISIVNNNTNTNDNHNEVILPYFNPDTDDIKIPEGYTVKTLDLLTILELYGYISPNQKYKMISSSIFDLPEEQISKLLKMYVLTEDELKESKVILNLIKLKGKLVTKEEALKYIFENELDEYDKNSEKEEN